MLVDFFKKVIFFTGLSILSSISLHAADVDLSITKSSPETLVNQSAAMSYDLIITNNSSSTSAEGVVVTDTLEPGMTYIGYSYVKSDPSKGGDWSCSSAGSPVVITCTTPEAYKADFTTITLNVTAPESNISGTVTFANSASVTNDATTTDPDLTNNTSNVVTVTLNRPPTAVNDIFPTASHTAVSGNVLTNDSDLDGDSLSVTNTGTFTISYGSITIAANGAFTYTPGYFSGETDSYTYYVSDGQGGTASATLYISISSECTAVGLVNAEREFCLRKQTVLFGDMVTIGNTLVVPPSPQPSSANQTTYCSSYTNGAFLADTPGLDNQSLYLCSYKPDANLNATTAELDIPAESTIKWAGLYLQSVVKHSDASALSSMNVKIKKDNGSYVDAGTPNVVNYGSYTTANSTNYDNYSAFIYVTSKFTANNWKDGSYTVANVPVTTDTLEGGTSVIGKYGAWSLVVIYENVSEQLKSVSIYDGWQKITGSGSSTSATITVDNFYTPTSGSIDSAVSIFAAEGDKYRSGDRFQAQDGGSWVDLGIPTSNAFDASISSAGTRTPLLTDNQGIDIETYQIGTSGYNLLNNAQSSISFKLWTGGDIDYFYPSMLAFSTEVYHPRMCYFENLYDSNEHLLTTGSLVAKGSAINVRVLLRNDMNEPAEKVMLYRTFDAALPYTSDSTSYKLDPVGLTVDDMMTDTTTPLTDALDADIFDYSPPLKLFSLHAGTGATYNQGGDFTFGQEALFKYSTSANFDGNTSMSYQIAYTMPTIGYRYEGELTKCEDFDNTFGVIPQAIVVGNMDIIENTSYVSAGSYAPADKNLFTKMVNKPFNLEAVYLDGGGNEQIYNGVIGNKIVNMAVMLYTTDSSTCTEENQLIWRGQIVNNNSHATAYIDNVDVDTNDEEEGFLITQASTDRKIKANFIDYGTLINNTSDLTCATSSLDSSLCLVPACLNSDTQILKVFPLADYPYVATCLYGDGGGAAPCDSNAYNGSCGGKTQTISPSKYNNDIGCAMCLADALGMNGCSSDNFAIRPDTYTTAVTGSSPLIAGQEFDLTTVAKGFSNTAVTGYNGIAAVAPQTQIDTCAVPDGNLTNSANNPFNAIVFNGVDTNVSNDIKFGDIGVFDINITDSTWTAVDSTKNPIECIDCNDTNIADASGKIGCLIKTVITPTVIPDHFDVNGTLTNGSNSFTYLNNFENNASLDQNISAFLNGVVTAKAFDINTTTLNYSSECYAKSGSSTISFSLTSITPAANLTQHLWYDDTNNSIIGSTAIGNTITPSHLPARFTNGVGNLNYRLNFDRSVIAPVNPFQMSIPQMDVTDTDNVNGNNSIDNNATYIYGRTHASKQRYQGPTGPANIYFESYCFTGCVKTLLNGFSPALRRTDDVRWYVNEAHAVPDDGAVGTITEKAAAVNVTATTPIINITPIRQTTTLTYDEDSGYPYRTTMENNASSWLIYNESNVNATTNEFQVEFDNIGAWTGEHETNTTTKTPEEATTNRRIMW
ncbi:MAG: hypothetical protein C0627_03245 [Sulfurimonas sp.]|nr:MAG: hypothetical protein C0627_03245 [Sulfurimonas sp.]